MSAVRLSEPGLLRFWCLAAVLLTFLAPAKAATTVYAASIFSQVAPVANAAQALGANDGLSATIGRTGALVLNLAQAVTGANVTVTGVKAVGGATVQVFLGAIVGGVPTFTPNLNFPGAGGTATFDFAASCAAISSAGCTLLRIRVIGPPAASFALDGVSGVSVAPEPGAWMLLVLGFIAVASRLKAMRRGAPFATPA